jgi:hypothetical protein
MISVLCMRDTEKDRFRILRVQLIIIQYFSDKVFILNILRDIEDLE